MTQHGGNLIAQTLREAGVTHLFALCGGHISPILSGAHDEGIRVVDVRDEANAVFAADAVARMSGTVGVAAVTAGPGVTNTLTALKNAQLAQTPLILFGGATATLLRRRGALQDIDQLALMRPATKWATRVDQVLDLQPTVRKAIKIATSGVPGPVFIEVPVDVLYPEGIVRQMFNSELGGAKDLAGKALNLFVQGYLYRQFHVPPLPNLPTPALPSLRELASPTSLLPGAQESLIRKAAAAITSAERPVIVIGSQTLSQISDPAPLVHALESLGVPVYLGGSARGLLGHQHFLQFRHARGAALKEADCVVVCGFPFDFRLGYGRKISRKATLIAANLSATELRKNRSPEIAVQMHAGQFLIEVAQEAKAHQRPDWFAALRQREDARDAEILEKSDPTGEMVDPLYFFTRLEEHLGPDATLVVDGGDFVATASYILRPRSPLSWLDPGVFGTLGVGGGMALGAALLRPDSQVWLIWGDGSSAFSLAELDSCARQGVAPIAIVGNDGSWAQIAREQVPMLGTAIGTELVRCDYDKVAEGYGAVGLLLTNPAMVDATLTEAKRIAATGRPVCINVHIRKSDFREGSISM